MYSVSQDYLNKLYGVGKKRRVVSALLDSVPFNEDDIIANSLKFTLQAASGAEITLGSVFLGQLWLTFTKPFANSITRGTWKGKTITLSIGLELAENVYEYIPCGVYVIEEANHTAKGVEVVAYDRLRKFDKDLSLSTTSGTPYSMITYACERCGVSLGMTREQIEDLPNGEEVFSIYPDNDMETYRDLLSYIAQVMGCFATTNRAGELVFRSWGNTSVQTLGIDDRYAGGLWSDFHTFYTGLSVTNIADQTTSYYNTLPDNGLTMNIGSNPLLQYGLDETKQRQRMAILEALGDFDYVPFRVTAFADPFFDLGDVITFTDGLAGSSSKCCIMRIDFSFSKGVTLQGYGKNPAQYGAQSKTDKDISGLAAQNKSNETKFQIYENVDQIWLTDEQYVSDTIATIPFSTTKDTTVEIQVVLNLVGVSEYALTRNQFRQIKENMWLYLDGDLISTYDKEKTSLFQSGQSPIYQVDQDMIEHYYAFKCSANELHTLTINLDYLELILATYGSGADDNIAGYLIYTGALKVYIKGQGLSVEAEWDGLITLTDEIERVHIGSVGARPIEDDVVVTITNNQPIDLTDEVAKMEIGSVGIVPLSESLSIVLTTPTFNTVDETGEYNIVSEDGLYNLITE